MSRREPLSLELVQRYKRLDDRGKALLQSFADTFLGSSVQWKRRESPQEQRRRFLDTLFSPGDGLIELRAIDPPHAECEWFEIGDYARVEDFVESWSLSRNVYVGVAARSRRGSTTADCSYLRCMFVDIDFKDIAEHEALQRIANFHLWPSLTVYSGGGLHLYWALNDRIDVRQHVGDIKARLRRAALTLGGDTACVEAARVLRLPGTLNHKYTPAREVILAAV